MVAGSSPEFGDPYSTKKFSISSFRSKLDVPHGRGLGDLYCGRALSILFALHAMAVSGTMCLHVLCGKCKTLATFASAWQARVEIEMRVWLEGTMRRTTNDSLQDSGRYREYTSSIVQFGEVVMGKLPNVKSISKGKPRWFKGIFVGRTDIDDAVVALTDAGAVTVRSIRIGCPPLTNMMSRFWIQRVVYHGP